MSKLDELIEKRRNMNPQETLKIPKAEPQPQGVYSKLAKLEQEKERQREAAEKQIWLWSAHQEAIVKSGQLTNDITKGIQVGEKPEILLLKAIKCISLMTGNDLFYELNRDNIKKIYGIDVCVSASGMESMNPEELEEFLNA